MSKETEFEKWIASSTTRGDGFSGASARLAWNAAWEFWTNKIQRHYIDIVTCDHELLMYSDPTGIKKEKERYGKQELLASLDKYITLEERKENDMTIYRMEIDVIKR
jgi:hypothetical protein